MNTFNPATMMTHIEAENEKVQKEITLKILRFVVAKSPVDSGRYKGSHVVSNKSASGSQGSPDVSGGATVSRGLPVIAQIGFGEKTFVQTNLPYSEALEFGHSNQAPGGVYRLAAQKVGGSS